MPFHIIIMCFYWPQQLPTDNQELLTAKYTLQALAASLFILGLFAVMAHKASSIFLYLLMAYILFLTWTEFKYEMALNFFLLSVIQLLFCSVELIGL